MHWLHCGCHGRPKQVVQHRFLFIASFRLKIRFLKICAGLIKQFFICRDCKPRFSGACRADDQPPLPPLPRCLKKWKNPCPLGRRSLSEQSVPGLQQFSGSNRNRRAPGKYFWGGVRSREIRKARSYSICNAAKQTKTKKTITIQ